MTKRRTLLIRDHDGLFALIEHRWRVVAEHRREPLSRERFVRQVLHHALGGERLQVVPPRK